ncbi:hypothetical protein GCM10025786_30420 [Nocardioides caeni]
MLVPGVPALLKRHASLEDPVAELRAACATAIGRLGPRVRVLASGPSAERVGSQLVWQAGGLVVEDDETGLLVVGNGSAKRTEKAPGHFDPRAEAFDEGLRTSFAGIDPALADELWADTGMLGILPALTDAEVLYDDAPFGVQYWVAFWG